MKTLWTQSIKALLALTLLTGVVYPVVVTVLAKVIFARQADGSLVQQNGVLVGSELIAQKFVKDEYFWPRPSASDFQTVASGASNLGPTSQALKDRVKGDMKRLGVDPASENKPYELLLTSGSGLDPHISPETALYQAPRVAKTRSLSTHEVATLIDSFTEKSTFGVLGRPRVNVLKLNLALDQMQK